MTTTYINFIKNVMCTSNSVTDIITQYNTARKKGYAYQRLWDILIRLGFCKEFNRKFYDNYEGSIEHNPTKIKNYERFFKDTHGIGPGGSSDITLRRKKDKKWVFVSCKYNVNTKDVDKYDITKIFNAATKKKSLYDDNFMIYIFVKNKKKAQEKFERSTTSSIKECIYNEETKQWNIFGKTDLKQCFQKFKDKTIGLTWGQVKEFIKRDDNKDILNLRFHQELIVHNTMETIENKSCQNILWAMKARSGKTYCVGGLFDKYFQKKHKLNALVITPAPKETLTQFSRELFDRYYEFSSINVVELKGKRDIQNINDKVTENNNIIIVSKQLLDDYVDKKHKGIEKIKNLKLDFIVFDENHFHGTTEMTKEIFTTYSSVKTIMLYLTATYFKPLTEWNIKNICQFYWDIEDEKLCKKRDIEGLIKKHGPNVSLFLNQDSKEEKLKYYDNMPDLYLETILNEFLKPILKKIIFYLYKK